MVERLDCLAVRLFDCSTIVSQTTITLEFTADGNCSIAVRGEAQAFSGLAEPRPRSRAFGGPATPDSAPSPRAGGRGHAEMSYRPQTPGRCAVPALREQGPVSLTVLLPPGREPPRASRPELAWAMRGDRVVGTATLAAAPEFVDIMPAGAGVRPIYGWALLAVAVFSLVWALRIGNRIAKAMNVREDPEAR
jgi:hypothetical protein